MSEIIHPPSPQKKSDHSRRKSIKLLLEDNNNTHKFLERQQARNFISWYKRMIDNERQNFALYLSDDATLEWFGRTIKTRKKVSSFLKYDMQCSRHDFTTVESIDQIQSRYEKSQRKEDSILARPLLSPEILSSKTQIGKKRQLRSNCGSPEWADGCNPEYRNTDRKRQKIEHMNSTNEEPNILSRKKSTSATSKNIEINSKGDGASENRSKRKYIICTPPNCEVGQGDCIPSTSSTEADKSHDRLLAQLPKLAVECDGFVEFTRTRNNRSTDTMKWERKCKVQISYSEDPLNVGEYVIWLLRYTDETKCKRNLLSAFENVAKEENLLQNC